MAQTIRLHGGPRHGIMVALEDDQNHFHVMEEVFDPMTFLEDPDTEEDAVIEVRTGMYSRVGKSGDFEWDGWRNHG